jgi:hypothetical protein
VLRVLVILDNQLHANQTVTVLVNGDLHDIPIVGRFAQLDLCCPVGQSVVTLVEPAMCSFAPVVLTCP